MNYRSAAAYYCEIASVLNYYIDLLRVHQLALEFSWSHKTVSHANYDDTFPTHEDACNEEML